MILRSASSPALNPRAAQKPSVPLGKSSTRTVTARPVSASPVGGKILMPRASSDGNLKKMRGVPVPERKTTGVHFEMASSNVLEESGFGGGRGSIGGGAAGAGGGGGGEEESVDAYYEEMIRRYPGDALLLANYARFLKEVKGDERRAEEYCERAILSEKSKDGNLLTMYGDLIWKNHKDSVRAQSYFDQAVRSSPHDCYVLASYARFLWDAEDDDDDNGDKDDEEEEEIKYQTNISPSNASVTVVS